MTAVVCPSCRAEVPAGFKFCGECGTRLAGPAPEAYAKPLPVAAPAPPPEPDGENAARLANLQRDEFRDVTVLFADVTGFTSLSEHLDPEALHAVMNACFDALGRIVQAHGGHIDKYIGDSIMALFGAPTAHEDDPLRAGEAALAMQAFLAGFRPPGVPTSSAFRMRIGINCGLVLAGSIGTQGKRDYSVMGDAVNTASRLEGQAQPGSILVSDAFKVRVERQFAFSGPTTLVLKGKDKPVVAWELLKEAGVTPARSDNDAALCFVGRKDELHTLASLLRQTAAAHHRWINVRGPLGIGKSHFVSEALRRAPDFTGLHVVCRPATRLRPFALAKRLLLALSGHCTGRATAPASREAFTAALAPLRHELAPFENALWYLAAPDALSLKAPDPDPLTFRRTLESGLERLLRNAAERLGNLVVVIDAIDLADVETLQFLETAYQAATDANSLPLIITTGREAAEGRASTRSNAATIVLPPLSPDDARQVALHASEQKLVGSAALESILQRAQGVPLFIRELVRSVLEASSADAATQTSLSSLPSSLLGVMSARLDRLDPAQREILAQCAVQGIEFSADIAQLVWRARGGPTDAVARHLRALEGRGFIEAPDREDTRYAFTQALMQSACYDSMLKRDRRTLHRDVAAALIDHAGGTNNVSAEQLATHYELSEQWMAAAQQNLRAGDRAAGLYANDEAIARYQRSLRALNEGGVPAEVSHHVAYEAHRGAALVHLRVGHYVDVESEAGAMQAHARDQCERAEASRLTAQARLQRGDIVSANEVLQTAERELSAITTRAPVTLSAAPTSSRMVACRILYDLAELQFRKGFNEEAHAQIHRCRKIAPDGCPDVLRLDILEGRIAHMQGRFHDAVDLYTRAYRAAADLGSLSEEALSSNYMGNAARDVGKYEDAERYFVRALEIWTRVGLTESMAGAHNNLANLAISRGNAQLAQQHYALALEAFEKISNAAGTGLARTNIAILAIEQGKPQEGVENAAAAKALLQSSGHRMLLGLASVVNGEAFLAADRVVDAVREFTWILAEYEPDNHPLAVAGATRGLGRAAIMTGNLHAAVQPLTQALSLYVRLAREQEAGRTELFLARAHALLDDRDHARILLAKAKERFARIGAQADLERAHSAHSELLQD